jgi:hypothetical protein
MDRKKAIKYLDIAVEHTRAKDNGTIGQKGLNIICTEKVMELIIEDVERILLEQAEWAAEHPLLSAEMSALDTLNQIVNFFGVEE